MDGYSIAFHQDWPNYGLPAGNYLHALKLLRSGDTNAAIVSLEAFLTDSVYDALQRRPLLSGDKLNRLDAALHAAAKYRQNFPVSITNSLREKVVFEYLSKAAEQLSPARTHAPRAAEH